MRSYQCPKVLKPGWLSAGGGTDVRRSGLDEQYFCSRSAASLVSPTVLLLRASTTLLHVGIGGGGGGGGG